MSLLKSRAWIKNVEAVLERAAREGREQLFEHEVYEILTELEIPTPVYMRVGDQEEITRETLSLFGSDRVVLKAISRGLAHKQKAGGVRVVYKDLDFVKFALQQMRAEVEGRGHAVEGILLVEYVEYSKDLGNEILLGFRESEAFGPVISFSKGGSDAEHFAANYSAPNLILAPINRKWASAVLSSTRIQKKFLAEGKTDFIAKIVEVEVKFSALAAHFSNFFPSPSRYALKEFEINPFVFDSGGAFIALDGYATFAGRQEGSLDLELQPLATLAPFFEPEGIAVIGLSAADNTKAGNIIMKNLLELEREDVYGVNVKGGEASIAGKPLPLYRSVLDIASRVDLAVITVPAQATAPVVQECGAKGVRAIILIPGGFSETTKDRSMEERILQIAREHQMRVIGPNCLGIVYAGGRRCRGINTFFIPEEKFKINLKKKKNVAILTQSGAMGIMEIYNLRNAISPKVIVSYGNQLDVEPSDLVQYFEKDPMVDVIGLYIEGFNKGAGRKFFNATAKSRKPIVVYKAGRTQAGQKATRSHTASISGEYEVAKAAMKQAGLVVADSMIDHGDFVKTFALLNDFKVTGGRVAVIANAGYEKTYAADNLEDLVLAELDEETARKMAQIVPPYVSVDSLLDLTPMVCDELFERCIDLFLQCPNVDALFISIVPQAQLIHTTDQEINSYKENIAARIVATVHRYKKPTVVSVNVVSGADAVYNRFGQVLDSGGVPTYLTAERAMVCLNEFIRYHLIKERKELSEWLR